MNAPESSADIEQPTVLPPRPSAGAAPGPAPAFGGAGAFAAIRPECSPGVVRRIEGYELIEELGAGGMGCVWRAQQLGTGRDVALKLLGAAHRHADGQARFVREVQLCARLQHPHIARVYDSGVHQNIYYYAMELVEGGIPLDQYIRKHGLRERQTLSLMRSICAAVGYAHQKLVSHRDLKPLNILVTPDGQPRVLDFGLAKAVAEAEAEADAASGGKTTSPISSLGATFTPAGVDPGLTIAGTAAGTVAYMSPEQAAGRVDQIDTRSDVYSLGKILFELLTGQPAHDLKGLTLDEQCQQITHQPVKRPGAVRRSLSWELERLLLKALERDPDRRYASATELARDLDNYLEGRPLAACPFGMGYVLRKWTAKHRVRVAAVAAALGVLIGTGVVSYVHVVSARGKAERVSNYLQRLLKSADPKNSAGREVTVKDLLAQVDRDVSREFASDPEVEATIRDTVGEVFLSLGAFADAEAQCARSAELRRRELGKEHPLTLSAMEHQARACRERGKFIAAEGLCRAVMEGRRRKLGADHPDTLRAMNTLAQCLLDGGRVADATGVIDETIRLGGKAVDANPPDQSTLELFATKARIVRTAGQDANDMALLESAEKMSEAILEGWRRLGRQQSLHADPLDDRDTLEAMHDLASVRALLGKSHEALSLYQETLRAGDRVLGPEHPDMLIWKNDYAISRWKAGQREAAKQLFESILPASERWRGKTHPYNVAIRLNLARVCRELEDWPQAQRNYEYLVTLLRGIRSSDDGDLLRCEEALASARSAQRDWTGAAEAYEKVWEARRSSPAWGPKHPDTLASARYLAIVLREAGRPLDAERVVIDALSAAAEPLAPEARAAAAQLSNLLQNLHGRSAGPITRGE